jgi:O-antigen/teichoic acid export membrane protein
MSAAAISLQIAVLLLTKSYLLYCTVLIFTTLAYNLLISRKADKLYPFIKRKAKLDAADRRNVFYNMKSMFIYKIAGVFFGNIDNILISVLIGTAVVGKYANYMLAVTNLKNITYMIFNSLSASVGNMIVKESPEKRLQVFNVMHVAGCWLSGFFIFCLFFLLDDFVMLWLGEEFVFDLITKAAILIFSYVSIILYPVADFREATGMYQKTKYIMVAAAALKVALAITLGIYFGLPGIIISAVITKLVTYAWYEPKVLFRDFFETSVTGYLLKNIINFIMLAACIAAAYFLFPWEASSGWFEWLLKGAVYAAAINIIYLLRYFKTPEFRVITGKLAVLIKKKR